MRTCSRYARTSHHRHGGAAGEWTPGYLIDFWTPDLVRACRA